MPSGHHNGLPPLVVVGVADEQVHITEVGSLLRGQVLLDGAVHEIDPAGHRLADHTAALQQHLQHHISSGPHLRHRGQAVGDQPFHRRLRQLDSVLAERSDDGWICATIYSSSGNVRALGTSRLASLVSSSISRAAAYRPIRSRADSGRG